MALGQAGPPATAKQLQYLHALLQKSGHATWREARRPLGLTQRRGSGKFTKREASELIDRLLASDALGDGVGEATPEPSDGADVDLDNSRLEIARGLPADVLAAELVRRGWTVAPPS